MSTKRPSDPTKNRQWAHLNFQGRQLRIRLRMGLHFQLPTFSSCGRGRIGQDKLRLLNCFAKRINNLPALARPKNQSLRLRLPRRRRRRRRLQLPAGVGEELLLLNELATARSGACSAVAEVLPSLYEV